MASSADTPVTTSKSNTKQKSSNVVKFTDEEFDLFSKTQKELNVDNENYEDLKKLPEVPPSPSEKELDKIIKDPHVKTHVTKPGELPSIMNTLGPGDKLGRVTDEDVRVIKEKNESDRKNLIILLAAKDSISLDVKIGTKEGKSIFIQKKFYYNPIDKREEFLLGFKKARLSEISHKYTIIVNKRPEDYTESDQEFLIYAPAMMEVAAYQFSEYEAKLRLGMEAEDFARVDVVQYGLALQVISWRTLNPSFANQEP